MKEKKKGKKLSKNKKKKPKSTWGNTLNDLR